MRALVTAFDPFGGERINSSLEAVRRLPSRIGALEVTTAELPTSYGRSLPALESAIARVRPDIVLEITAIHVDASSSNARPARAP